MAYENKSGDGRRGEQIASLVNRERPMPHNLDVEKAILAGMLLDPENCVDIVIEKLGGGGECFYHPAHQKIYQTIVGIYQADKGGVDYITLSGSLKNKGVFEEVGGDKTLMELSDLITTTANIEAWCGSVRELAQLRDMIVVCHSAIENCYNGGENVEDVMGIVEADVLKVREAALESEIVEIKDLAADTFKYFEDLYHQRIEPGIPTGLPELDKKITGLKKGEMVVLAARPSIGKTSLGLNVIRNIALRQDGKSKAVAFFSLEMTAEQIARRFLCTEADISEKEIHDRSIKPVQLSKLTKAAETFKAAKIYIDATPGIKVGQLRAKARRLKARHGVELVVIDYLQLMNAEKSSESRQQEVSEISHGIKSLAKELDLPVLVLAQLNRELEKGGKSNQPKLSHLRESGAIEQDADIVIFLHRDRDKQKEADPKIQSQGIEAQLIIEKNRNGETGIVDVLFFPKRMLFSCPEHRFSREDASLD